MATDETTLDLRTSAPTLHVKVGGPLQSEGLTSLRQALHRAWFDGVTIVEIDLSTCSFLGSPAAAFLVNTQRTARHRGGALTLISPSPAVQRFLAASGLGRVLEVARGRSARPSLSSTG
jgi:anti-anti-sigma factor